MDKQYFQEKGKIAEEFIAKLCSNAFQEDFCFKNPFVNGRELCDVLVILQNVALIWQIKSIKEKDGEINKREVDKAIRQCLGAKRTMQNTGYISITNVNMEIKNINCNSITKLYLIVAIEDGIPITHSFFNEIDSDVVHIFFSPFTMFAIKYLNTVSDLADYLFKKEEFLKGKSLIINGGEEDFLAHFLANARTFGNLEQKGIDMILFEGDNYAKKFEASEEVKIRFEEEEKYCSITDHLIKKRRESISPYSHVIIPQEVRDHIISLFLKMNALEKRLFGKLYWECLVKAHKINKSYSSNGILSLRDYYLSQDVLFIFVFLGDANDKDKEKRRAMLEFVAYGAIKRSNLNFSYIIGIATEINSFENSTQSFEWLYLNYTDKAKINKHIQDEFPDLEEILDKLSIFTDPRINKFSESEYKHSEILTDIDLQIQKADEK